MLVQELVNLINGAVETYNKYTPDVLIPYINYGIDELSLELASTGDPDFLVSTTIVNGLTVPEEFIQFVPKDGYPVRIENAIFLTTNGQSNAKIKYAKAAPHINKLDDPIPFKYYNTRALVNKIISMLHADKTLKYVVENPQVDQYVAERNLAALKKAKGG